MKTAQMIDAWKVVLVNLYINLYMPVRHLVKQKLLRVSKEVS